MTRRLAYELLDPGTPGAGARAFRWIHHAAVLGGVLAMMIDTSPRIHMRWGAAFEIGFYLAFAFFALEYALRLYAAPEAPWGHPETPWRSRFHWAGTTHGVIDLLAILPIALSAALHVEPSLARLLSILWLLKLAPYSVGLSVLARVVRNSHDQLLSVLLAFAIILLTAGTLAYIFERDHQPESFGSIPGALWWAIVTLTTTGYGDVVPQSFAGRMLAGVVMMSGLGIFGLWAGILASGFAEEIRRREFLQTWDLVAQVPFFHDVGAATIAEVTRLLKPREVSTGTVIMRRGQGGDSMYFVVDGEVEIQLPAPVRLGAGAFFGEIALLTGGPRTATVVAARPTTLLVLHVADFRELVARRPELAQAIREEGARRAGRQAGYSATRS